MGKRSHRAKIQETRRALDRVQRTENLVKQIRTGRLCLQADQVNIELLDQLVGFCQEIREQRIIEIITHCRLPAVSLVYANDCGTDKGLTMQPIVDAGQVNLNIRNRRFAAVAIAIAIPITTPVFTGTSRKRENTTPTPRIWPAT